MGRKRFLDDLFFGWTGTVDEFLTFKAVLNEVGCEHGVTFKGMVGESVDFLDTTVTLQVDGRLTTTMFVKPTDATRYLNRRSDHSPHTFYSIPFSQFRRAVVLCSDENDKTRCMDYITEKLKNSGYKPSEIQSAREKAMKLERNDILSVDRGQRQNTCNADKQLVFLINRDSFMCSEIKKITKKYLPDFKRLVGENTRIIVAERRNSNIASSVFAKSSFSRNVVEVKENQKCKSGYGCKSCKIMETRKSVTVWKKNNDYKKTVRLDFKCDCLTECAIYMYMCNICIDNDSFYVGQTHNSCRTRANGHRACFNIANYQKSALSYHIYNDHPQYINRKLSNYSMGIIKSVSPANLDREEDYYVEHYDANLSLNRYKVTS